MLDKNADDDAKKGVVSRSSSGNIDIEEEETQGFKKNASASDIDDVQDALIANDEE